VRKRRTRGRRCFTGEGGAAGAATTGEDQWGGGVYGNPQSKPAFIRGTLRIKS